MQSFRKRFTRVAKRTLLSIHETGLRSGVVVLPKHSYVAIPDLHALRRTRARWARKSEMRGVAVDLGGQMDFLTRTVLPFEPEYRGNVAYKTAVAGAYGTGFGYIEAQALHGVVRSLKPRKVIEIGSGVSTYCLLEALARNAAEGAPSSVTCIEAYPSEWLKAAPVRTVRQPVQEVDPDLFTELGEGDLLFVDSTHTVRIDSDVNMIVLEILPRLRPGVVVHFHDIALPFDYLPDAENTLFQWMETALLHAFLIGNTQARILVSLSHLHHERTAELKNVFPEYVPERFVNGLRIESSNDEETRHFPSSTYLTTGTGFGTPGTP